MPTYREDMHTGHKVPLVETDDINNRSVTEEKMADDSVSNRTVQDDAIDSRNLRPKAIKSYHIDDKQVLARHIGDDVIPTYVRPITNNLQNQIDSLEIAGLALSNEFGDNPHIGITQKKISEEVVRLNNLIAIIQQVLEDTAVSNEFGQSTTRGVSQNTLTEAFNKLWQKIEEMTGEQLQGINMVVTPEYFISEDGCTVHISANTVETNGIFEHIAFYINGELIAEADNTDLFEYETSITETSVIKCVAKIMGIEYTQQKVVTHYNSFWLGAGSTYTDIMDVEHVIPITNGMRGAYNVDVADGQRIIIIVGDSLKDGFLRADLNSVEIPFTETSVTVDGKGYKVYTSEPWSAGSYNIDING